MVTSHSSNAILIDFVHDQNISIAAVPLPCASLEGIDVFDERLVRVEPRRLFGSAAELTHFHGVLVHSAPPEETSKLGMHFHKAPRGLLHHPPSPLGFINEQHQADAGHHQVRLLDA